MAIPDDALAGLLATVRDDLAEIGMLRARGGLARGVAWAEASGRGPDGAWLELRVHHRPSERRLDAGLLAYEPVARGGRTVVVGERSLMYSFDATEVADHLAEEVSAWVRLVSHGQSALQRLSAG